jgi:hypothetical protein
MLENMAIMGRNIPAGSDRFTSRIMQAADLEAEVARTMRGSREHRYAVERLETLEETGVDPGPRVNIDGAPGPVNTQLPIVVATGVVAGGIAAAFPTAARILFGWITATSGAEAITGYSTGALNPMRVIANDLEIGRDLARDEQVLSGVSAILGVVVPRMINSAPPNTVGGLLEAQRRARLDLTLKARSFQNDPIEVFGQQTRAATPEEVRRYELGMRRGGVEVGYTTYDDGTNPQIRTGDEGSVRIPGGPGAITTWHSHTEAPAIFSGGDIGRYFEGPFAPGVTHSVTGEKWAMTNQVLRQAPRIEAAEGLVTTSAPGSLITSGAARPHDAWNRIQEILEYIRKREASGAYGP